MNFKTEKIACSIYSENKGEIYSDEKAYLEWELTLETREWGVKYIDITPTKLVVKYIVEGSERNGGGRKGEQCGEDEIDLTTFNVKVNRTNTSDSILPDLVEVNHKTNLVEIYF